MILKNHSHILKFKLLSHNLMHSALSELFRKLPEIVRIIKFKLTCFSTLNIMNNLNNQKQLNEGREDVKKSSITDFEHFGLNYELLRGIYAFGYEKPASIQVQGVPAILTKKDCIIQGQAGTGKTATFAIGTLQLLKPSPNVEALVLTPTRQLATQITFVFQNLSLYTGIKVKSFVGGTDTREDKTALKNGDVNVAIGTPGRIKQMIERKFFKTDHLKLLILDEADHMLETFTEAMQQIFAQLPADVQVCLVSATMTKQVLDITQSFMKDPIKILLQKKMVTVQGIKQFYIAMIQDGQKFGTLIQLYKNIQIGQCIVFTNSKERAHELNKKLLELKFPIVCMTGDMEDQQRRKVMKEFREGHSRILIATDLVGRGIDVQGVNLVINFDVPYSLEQYIHRIGRTGRLGKKGVAINFVTQGNATTLAMIQKQYGSKMQELPMDLANIYN